MGGSREKGGGWCKFHVFCQPSWTVQPGSWCECVCVLQGDIVFDQPRDGHWISKQELHPSFHLFFVSSGKMEDEAEIMCEMECSFQGCLVRLLM